MEKSIFELFETIFSEDPKPPKSISVEIDILDTSNTSVSETQLSDNFEILLHMFIYGFKKLKLTFSEESLSILKKYFASLDPSINFNIEIEPFDSALFGNIRYAKRYCKIDSSFINSDDVLFISNYNQINRNNLNEFIAVYQDEYESMIFINFDFL
jgi:hypothetical protein